MIRSSWTRRLGVAASLWALLAVLTALTGSAQAPVPRSDSTVWSGVYSAEQAKRGAASANRSCAKCHNADLTGGQDGPSLVGRETLEAWSTLTLGDLFDRIKTTMPADAPQTLSAQETADILAYVLSLNRCPAGEKELPSDAAALGQVRITSRPDPDQRPSVMIRADKRIATWTGVSGDVLDRVLNVLKAVVLHKAAASAKICC
jgi:quinoprotein glucose dehydrogenase